MNLILYGLPGSGKSTYGPRLAKQEKKTFIDTDQLIEQLSGISCRELFKQGEEQFRDFERKAVAQASSQTNIVIAVGGGTMMDEENVRLLKRNGIFIFLNGPLDFLFKNATQKGIPAYLDPDDPWASFQSLALKRLPIYEKLADKVISFKNVS